MNRRDFLKKIGYTAAAGASGVVLSKLPERHMTLAEVEEEGRRKFHWSDLSLSTAAYTTLQEATLLAYDRAEMRRLRGYV